MTLVTLIIMLLQLYRGIFRTLRYLMPEAYSKSHQISKMVRHIENPGIVRKVCSDIFKDIQRHPAILSHVYAYWGTLGQIEECSGITEAYWSTFIHIQNSV